MGFVPVGLIYFLPELSSFAFVSGSSKTQRMILPMRNIVASSIAKRLSLEQRYVSATKETGTYSNVLKGLSPLSSHVILVND